MKYKKCLNTIELINLKGLIQRKINWLDKNFKYQQYYCNECHDMSMKAMSMHNLAIVYYGGNAYRINLVFMTVNEAINKLKKF